MPIVSLEAAKSQLNVTENDDDLLIITFLNAAIGMVEHEIQLDIYEKNEEVPTNAVDFIVYSSLKKSKKAALEAAVMLALTTLYTYRESELDVDLSQNPAFKACLLGFNNVVIG